MDLSEIKQYLEYNPDTGFFRWIKKLSNNSKNDWQKGNQRPDGYTYLRILGKQFLCHRLAWLFTYGEFPESFLDHINEVKNDNRISNLRLTDKSLNGLNTKKKHKDSLSEYKGVSQTPSGKWMSKVCVNTKQIYLGSFKTPEEAYKKYLEEKAKYLE